LEIEENIAEFACKIIRFHPCCTRALGHILW